MVTQILIIILFLACLVRLARAEDYSPRSRAKLNVPTRLNIAYLRPDEASEFAKNIPTIEEQKLWVRKALDKLPVRLSIVRETVGLDTCTKQKHENFYNVLFCYKRIAKKYKLRRKKLVITLAVTPPYVLHDRTARIVTGKQIGRAHV